MNERCTVYIKKKIMNDTVPALYDGKTERLGDLNAHFLLCRAFSVSRPVVWSLVREVL